MVITATELKINLGKYLSIAQNQDVFITKNGKIIAKLTNVIADKVSILDGLVGIVSQCPASANDVSSDEKEEE